MTPSDLTALVALVRNRIPYCRPVLTPEEATVLCDAIEELQRELEARNRDLDALQKHLASLNQPTL